jgi:hypothetical protein
LRTFVVQTPYELQVVVYVLDLMSVRTRPTVKYLPVRTIKTMRTDRLSFCCLCVLASILPTLLAPEYDLNNQHPERAVLSLCLQPKVIGLTMAHVL